MLIKKTLENYFSRITIVLINQFSIIISIFLLANNADIKTFGQLSISFILINKVYKRFNINKFLIFIFAIN